MNEVLPKKKERAKQRGPETRLYKCRQFSNLVLDSRGDREMRETVDDLRLKWLPLSRMAIPIFLSRLHENLLRLFSDCAGKASEFVCIELTE